jgi:hypothetical protein
MKRPKFRGGWTKVSVTANDRDRVGRLLGFGMDRKGIAEILGIPANRVDYIRGLLRPKPTPEAAPEPTPEPTSIGARGPMREAAAHTPNRRGPRVSAAERKTYKRLYLTGATRGEIMLLMGVAAERVDVIRRSVKLHNKGQLPALETELEPAPTHPWLTPEAEEARRRRRLTQQGAEIAEAALVRVAETFALAATQMREAAASTRDWTE